MGEINMIDDSNCKIFCCTHVETEVVDKEIYVPLQTGRAYDGYDIPNMLGDNTGNHISNKKDLYDGFLTGMYWIWKNTTYDYVGICNYRSYIQDENGEVLNKKSLERLFGEEGIDFCVVTNQCMYSIETRFKLFFQQYYGNNLHDFWKYMRDIIGITCPDYLDALEYVLSGQIYNCRYLFVTRKIYFDSYCKWLFEILEQYEKLLSRRKFYANDRFLGYLGEILERVWLVNQKLKVKELSVKMVSSRNVGLNV